MELQEAIDILENRRNREISIEEMLNQQEALELVLDRIKSITILLK